ncbi:MAG: 30S ribosomal protein S12 methylthiotransferase RimO [Bacillota bacterium]
MQHKLNLKKLKVAVVSLGCAKNRIDTEEMLGLLGRQGHIITGDPAAADAVIVNTCAFIEDAQQESIDTLIKLARRVRGKKPVIIAAGCLAEFFGEKLLQSIPELSGVIGVHSYSQLTGFLENCLTGTAQSCLSPAPEHYSSLGARLLTTPRHSVYVKIAEGCNNRCRYCLIPALRGPLRSRPAAAIIEEIRQLVRGGAREINLIAQDTTAYGTELSGAPDLASLVEQILAEVAEFPWLRILYAYPSRLTGRLIDLIASEPRICKYLDLPLQHVSTTVLKRMGRPYTREHIIGLITRLRHSIPGLALRTTYLTGFPGETREEFTELAEFLTAYPFEHVGVFAYSSQPGTAAAAMENQVIRRVARKRRRELMERQQAVSLRLNRARLEQRLPVLVERRSAAHPHRYYGRTAGQAPEVDGGVCFLSAHPLMPGSFVSLKIGAASPYHLLGFNPRPLQPLSK